jgi:hypothetical protein
MSADLSYTAILAFKDNPTADDDLINFNLLYPSPNEDGRGFLLAQSGFVEGTEIYRSMKYNRLMRDLTLTFTIEGDDRGDVLRQYRQLQRYLLDTAEYFENFGGNIPARSDGKHHEGNALVFIFRATEIEDEVYWNVYNGKLSPVPGAWLSADENSLPGVVLTLNCDAYPRGQVEKDKSEAVIRLENLVNVGGIEEPFDLSNYTVFRGGWGTSSISSTYVILSASQDVPARIGNQSLSFFQNASIPSDQTLYTNEADVSEGDKLIPMFSIRPHNFAPSVGNFIVRLQIYNGSIWSTQQTLLTYNSSNTDIEVNEWNDIEGTLYTVASGITKVRMAFVVGAGYNGIETFVDRVAIWRDPVGDVIPHEFVSQGGFTGLPHLCIYDVQGDMPTAFKLRLESPSANNQQVFLIGGQTINPEADLPLFPLDLKTTANNPTSTQKTDSFNRANSTTTLGNTDTGQVWTAVTGTWGITSNTAYPVTNTLGDLATFDSGLFNGTFGLSVTAGFTQAGGLVFRGSDVNNYLLVQCFGSTLELYKRDNGVFTSLARANAASGTIITVTANGPLIVVQVDGVTKITYTLSTSDFAKYGLFTRVGMRSGATAGSQRFDAISATPLTSSSLFWGVEGGEAAFAARGETTTHTYDAGGLGSSRTVNRNTRQYLPLLVAAVSPSARVKQVWTTIDRELTKFSQATWLPPSMASDTLPAPNDYRIYDVLGNILFAQPGNWLEKQEALAAANTQVQFVNDALAFDDFNRADSAITATNRFGSTLTGQAWLTSPSLPVSCGIFNNQFQMGSGPNFAAFVNAVANGRFSSKITSSYYTTADKTVLELMFRYNSVSENLGVRLENNTVSLVKRDGSTTATSLTSTAMTTTNGTTYLVDVVALGNEIQVFVDGVQRLSHTLTGGDIKYANYTRAGYFLYSTIGTGFAPGVQADDFTVRAGYAATSGLIVMPRKQFATIDLGTPANNFAIELYTGEMPSVGFYDAIIDTMPVELSKYSTSARLDGGNLKLSPGTRRYNRFEILMLRGRDTTYQNMFSFNASDNWRALVEYVPLFAQSGFEEPGSA